MKTIRAFLLLLALALAAPAWAATLLPPGEQVFLDQNGAPLAGGQVYFYVPNTLTPKATYQNASESVSNTNPVLLDGSGRAIIYGSGQYRQRVYDVNGNLIWDQLTADTSSTSYSWAGTSAGTANAQTLSAPNFTLGDGQQIGFIAGFSNSGPLSVIVNGGSPISVVQATATGPGALGNVIAGNQYFLSYSATNGNFQISPLLNGSILPAQPIVASATTDLGSLSSQNASISGSTTITSFGASASTTAQFYFVTFTGSPLITASTSILTPNSANIQAYPGLSAFLAYLGNGVWQVISLSAQPLLAPQVTVLSNATGSTITGTYTTPTASNGALPLDLEVEMCGPGSGGGGSGGGSPGVGAAGSAATTFGTSLLTANPGPATPANTATAYPTPATATGGDTNIAGALGAGPGGLNAATAGVGFVPYGASSPLGAGGPPTTFNPDGVVAAGSATGFCAGGGAGGYGANVGYNSGWGGNAGAYLKAIITAPAASYAYAIGAAGTGGALGTDGAAGGNGSGGYERIVARFQ